MTRQPSARPKWAIKSPIDGTTVRVWEDRADANQHAATLSERMGRSYSVWPANHAQPFIDTGNDPAIHDAGPRRDGDWVRIATATETARSAALP